MPTIQITDETTGRRDTHTWTLDFLDETVIAQEIIRCRVYEEVLEYNAKNQEVFRGLVQPTDTERELNGFKLKPGRKIDWESQYARAIQAFAGNGFIMLVDNTQIETLEEPVHLREGTTITFLKLVPLVGG